MTPEPKQLSRRADGYTLIELMVVVLIIAILIAISIPTFFSARVRADNRAAQTSLRHALIAAKTMYTEADGFADADESSTGLRTVEPSLAYVAHASNSSGPNVISVRATATSWSAAVHSASNSCYWVREGATSGTTYGGEVKHPSSCSGDDANGAVDSSFP